MKMKVRNKAAWSDAVTPLEEKNKQVSYEAATEAIVLLENDGCLPVEPGKIALYGSGADKTIKGGTGSGEVNERHAISIMEGLEMAGFTITTKSWIEEYQRRFEEKEDEYRKTFRDSLLKGNIKNIMGVLTIPFQYPFDQAVIGEDINKSDTDTCVYVVARLAGEGADKKLDGSEYALTREEKANIAFCAANYKKMILVINVGSTFDMSFLDEIEGINAVVYFCQQGTMGGKAFADLLCGKVSPSGKTVDTWAKKYEDIPFANDYSYINGNVDEEYYREGIFVGYRYFDTFKVAPKYPFGYGLSYTDFEIQTESVVVDKTEVTVNVNVTNTGDSYAGKEVVQVYVSCPDGKLKKEYQKLAAFAKTKSLAPGESETLAISFKMDDMASYMAEEGAMLLEPGNYVIRVGNSSRNTKVAAVIKSAEEIIVSKHANICKNRVVMEELQPEESNQEVVDEAVPIYDIKAADFECQIFEYKIPEVYHSPEIDAVLNVLSVKEMVSLTVGSGTLSSGKYFCAPGSAGITTGKLIEKGVPDVSLADGPAGLRLQRRSVVLKNGKLKPVDPFISTMKYIPEPIKGRILGDPEKHPVIYQFTTAFPVGLALAQTWNTELLEKVGTAVGEEMKAYGVTYWLAPALNIHRNPLCGRNFEYFSEDPYLAGKMTSAITKGVQSSRGCYVTIKHFCCNNQEDNRMHTNANVSERALREIYLRGFEIAVKESKPGAIMTSYNKVNGVYANNSYDLLTKLLRNEWGFDGVVMTDWFATGKTVGNHALAIATGNDLIMPGSESAEKEIYKAVKAGLITEEDVKRCAANVLKGIMGSRIYQAYKKSSLLQVEE